MKNIRKKVCVIMLLVSLVSNCLFSPEMAWATEVENDYLENDTVEKTFTKENEGLLSVDVGKCYAFDISEVADITGDVDWSIKSDGAYNGQDGENTLVDWKDSDEKGKKRILQVKDYKTPEFYQNNGIITITVATGTNTIAQWEISINKIITKAATMQLEKDTVTVAKNKNTSVGIVFTSEISGKTVNEEIKVSSDNENVATGSYDSVNQALYVKAVGAGRATITVTTVQSNLTATCTVNVSEYLQKDGITYYQNENHEGIVKKVETNQLFYQLPEAVDWTPFNILETGAFSECTATGMFQLPIGGQAGGITGIGDGAFPTDKTKFNVMLAAPSPEVKATLEQMGINVVLKSSNMVLEKGKAVPIRLNAPDGLQTQWSVSTGSENVSLNATEGSEVVVTGVTKGNATVVGTNVI